MDREGSSKSAEEEKPKEPVVVEKASGEPKKAEDPTTKKRPRKNEDDAPETSDDEDQRAETAGSRNYPANLWNRLKNPPANRPTIDVWEFKLDGEVLTMTFTCDGEKYPMYFTPRSVIDFQMRNNYWIPRHNNTFKSLRTRLYSLPKTVSINKLVFSEWQKGERNIEEIQLHLDRVIEPNFVDHLNADHADPKRVKVRRVVNGRKTTLYIERDRLGSRHLALRTLDTK